MSKRSGLLASSGIPIIGARKPNSQCVAVLQAAYEQAMKGEISAVALILIDKPGEFRVVGAGTDVDGLHAGCVELFKQLDKLVTKAEQAYDPKVILDA